MLGRAGEEGKGNGDEAKKKVDTLSVVVMRSGCATGASTAHEQWGSVLCGGSR
jgi:hypothetical protein